MDTVVSVIVRGTRLGDLTDDRPRGLVDVVGRPLLAHAFETGGSRRGPTGWSWSPAFGAE